MDEPDDLEPTVSFAFTNARESPEPAHHAVEAAAPFAARALKATCRSCTTRPWTARAGRFESVDRRG